MSIIYVKIDGITCDNCRKVIKKQLLTLKEIKEVEISKNIAKITIKKEIDKKLIVNKINDIGYFTKEEYISNDINVLNNNIKLKEFIIIALSILLIIFLLKKIFGYNVFNMIPTIDNNITYGMLFITGLLTSIHCISMCGAITIMATLNKGSKNNIIRPFLYNLGRLISYSILGGLVGLLGKVLSINETINGIIIIIASISMILISLRMMNIIKFKLPKIINIKVKTTNPFVIGLLNGLMPCGPLQAMQIYALSTGSFYKGFISMFLFCLGTIPLMLSISLIFNIFKGKKRVILNKIASVLILILSITMLLRGISTLGINYSSLFNNNYNKAVIHNDYQEVNIKLSYGSYEDIVVKKGIKVKLIINVDKKYLTGCNNVIMINKFNIKQELKEGENIIEFIPDEVGVFPMNCWMNMITNNIKVIA